MTNKILIVDDEPNNLDVLRDCLYDAGFKVMVAKDGEKALKRIAHTKPDLILLDIIMPGMDGFETCRRLKQNEVTKDTPIIFITAKTETVNKVKGLKMNAVDYITKPFQPKEVIARVNKHLTIHNLRKQLEVQNTQLQNYVYHLESLASLGKAINGAKSMTEMMNNALQVTLAVFNCDRAWLLYPCEPNVSSLQVPMEVTRAEYPGANVLNTDIPMDPKISKVMKTTLSANGPVAFGPNYKNKIPSIINEKFSVQSQLCLAIQPKTGKPWQFGIHQCSHARIWTETEIKLFQEFGQQIGVSLELSISVEELQKTQERLSRKFYHNFVGASKLMQVIYQTIDDVASSEASILITGESGTGKELCAEAIYKESKRADKPFMICNCAVIPANLLENHLFGHAKGAFTGADDEQNGLVTQVNGGTLFLDEIGELSLSMQSSLLRFVQTKTFHKVGSHKPEKADVRLIYATNRNLLIEIKAGRFREDLYFRINPVEINLPALCERGQDILLLAEFFLFKFAKQEQKDWRGFSHEAEKMLLKYEWPGNVRQLQGVIHSLVILGKGNVITVEMLKAKISTDIKNEDSYFLSSGNLLNSDEKPNVILTSNDVVRPLEEIEQEVINKAIECCNGSVVKAAKLLGISRSTIYRKQQRKPSK
ncbi:sigma 54-interacting transcriptional regulator [Candidatus Parabeggiatoa sp. HSG14]|uniref:sigma 54-interacting transcriptional regulator n=1 Tax=Candidatus Parabeggiatoa sp. HSG14 TaxID=3055593 RepID=UPI0025A7F0CC|nr:sigma 54-interacting transcriptional regulator [Thiotrichales bacterium HSG14]